MTKLLWGSDVIFRIVGMITKDFVRLQFVFDDLIVWCCAFDFFVVVIQPGAATANN